MSSPSIEWGRGFRPWFHIIAFVLVWINLIRWHGELLSYEWGGLQVHEICRCSLVYKEVVEALSNYKNSSFWWFGNPACSDSIASKQIEKKQGRVSLRPVWGKRGKRTVWFSVFGLPLNDWANGGSAVVLFTYDQRGFSFLRSWFYSKEWVWNLVTKSMLHCFK